MADDRRSIDQQRMLPPEFEQGASRVDDLFDRPVSLTLCRPPGAGPAVTGGRCCSGALAAYPPLAAATARLSLESRLLTRFVY